MITRAAAGFDALSIAERLTSTEGGAAPAELHLFAYLACLLAFYDGRAPEVWSYGFAATPAGAPHAMALAAECDRLRAVGRLVDKGEVLVVPVAVRNEIVELRGLRSMAVRDRYLEAACAMATLQPLPAIADALSFEPQLQRSLGIRATRELFGSVGRELLEEHFAALATGLREHFAGTKDLLSAASVWLTYLTLTGQDLQL